MSRRKLVLKKFFNTRYSGSHAELVNFSVFLYIFSFHFYKIVLVYIITDTWATIRERRTLMAKKFGKVLLLTAALGAVAGGAYYYLKGRDAFMDDNFDDDDDFDNFDEELDEGDPDRNYVNLDLNKAETSEEASAGLGDKSDEKGGDGKADFKEGIQVAKAAATDKVVGGAKKVEEFFDDEDDDDYTEG